jgi:glycosyltransferase involved in cell wall biosynthesis
MHAIDSPSVQSLLAMQIHDPHDYDLVIYIVDNTPGGHELGQCYPGIHYIACPENLGLANAYNRVLEYLRPGGFEWMLTLDQDTFLPPDYLRRAVEHIRSATERGDVAAIVPQITAGQRVVSPYFFQFRALPRWYKRGYVGIPNKPTFSLNSGSLVNIGALEQAGGYDPWFWLDNSDACMFSRLHAYGKSVLVAGDISVDHDFSMKNMSDRMSPQRYRNILLAESALWDTTMSWLAGCERTLRLVLRLGRHWMRHDNPELQRTTWAFLWMRLFRSRRYRIQSWREATREHLGESLEATAVKPRESKISVCMAAYNGADYIAEQLRSILSQLRSWDEVVIVDDCSEDGTVGVIENMHDNRIRLLRNSLNRGVVATFEKALRCATGDILMLSDDDDIWVEGKVRKYIEAFEKEPTASIVSSQIQLIDGEGKPFEDLDLTRAGKFVPGFWQNVCKNHYQGSNMAIRSSLLKEILPFPVRPSFQHDVWIGTRNDLTGGKTVFLEEPLLLYRRHGRNVSRRLSRMKQIRQRLELLWAHLAHVLR